MCDGVLDYIVSGLFLLFFWCPCMAINVNVQTVQGFKDRIMRFYCIRRYFVLIGDPRFFLSVLFCLASRVE